MTIVKFLSDLRDLDIKLWIEGDRLCYSAPEGAVTFEIRGKLSQHKTEILKFLQQAKSEIDPICKDFPKISRKEKLPLSFSQQRLWFLDRLNPGSPVYNMSGALQIRGILDLGILEKSLNEIIRRHEIWRTNFRFLQGEATQVVRANRNLKLKLIKLQKLSSEEQQAEVIHQVNREAQKPFDLERGSLLRATLWQLGEDNNVLLLNMHHIISDLWSMGILVQELTVLYDAFSQKKPSPLAELSIQYADYAYWQRQWLKSAAFSQELSYWTRKLSGNLPILQIPTARPHPQLPTFRGARQSITLPKILTEKLKALSQKQGVTLFMVMLAAFKTLLYRYTQQSDLLVGTAISGRNQPEFEEMIGCFVNTLVIRTNLANNSTFLTFLQQVREVVLEAYAHQNFPFEKLVEELQPERDLSQSPLYQVGFAFYNTPEPKLKLSDLNLQPIPIDNGTAKLDLMLSLREDEGELTGWLEYKTDLFDYATITRMLGHFQTLLTGIVDNPEQSLSELPLLTTAEYQQLLWDWNNTQVDYPDHVCVHQIFEAQVEQTPNAIAVICEDKQLTYQELNAKANQLAHHLQKRGVTTGEIVGLCVETSLEAIVGILGIIKAGGAYVPLDPTYPIERLGFMVEDAKVSMLLTQKHLVCNLPDWIRQNPSIPNPQIINIDSEWQTIAKESSNNLPVRVKPDDLVYAIYTSGSTGKPKGVPIQHRGLCNLAKAQIQAFGVDSCSRVLQFASLSFDASVSEIFISLLKGARLYLTKRDHLFPISNLIKFLREKAISIITLPPSVLAILPVVELPELQTIIVAGEACSSKIAKKWADGRKFFNAYGPTEATVCATIAECNKITEKLPIGRPINNTQIYILDHYLQPVPIGVPGELYIGGVGIAQGYLNQPELTHNKFISHLFDGSKGKHLSTNNKSFLKSSHLYKSGDLARYLPDGNIEFLGRIDNQVKIRGFRIEVGEIEAVLNQHSEIQDSIITAWEYQTGEKILIANIIPKNFSENLSKELKNYLRTYFPDYMIPNRFVILKAFPLTANGKVDRQALPIPEIDISKQSRDFIPPRDTIEVKLNKIWEEVLNLKSISVTDNFFELGGHSLQAVRLMTLIESQFGQELPLSILFEAGTIEHLATIIRSKSGVNSWSPLVGIKTSGTKQPFFCVHPIGGNVLGYANLARYLAPEQKFYALQAPGIYENQKPFNSIQDLAAYYIKALQLVQPSGSYFIGGHSFGGLVAFEMAQQLQAQGDQVGLLAIIDTPAPIHGETSQPIDDAEWLLKRAKVLERFFNKNLSVVYEELQKRKLDEQLDYFLEKLRAANLIPPDTGRQMISRILQVQKASHQALVNYRPLPLPYRGRITLLRVSEVLCEDSQGVFAKNFRKGDFAWGELTTESPDIYQVSGNHITMLAEPHVKNLAKNLQSCIDLTAKTM
ncbi:non-ribosomal peptide synthetase [Mastigocoleus testarum]|uniref:Carrier domain-containing protein n=1 Tax=Mastigocoleus testarum BC008 TaxID=371196 RepID=A0A0V8A100_9CYAN|nr:non-ribosomal peptide synthetase [Mastigocoleus testarum]KST70379.1 hypothetical protein BC008_45095 [Mastigocoleus testarum BC008]